MCVCVCIICAPVCVILCILTDCVVGDDAHVWRVVDEEYMYTAHTNPRGGGCVVVTPTLYVCARCRDILAV